MSVPNLPALIPKPSLQREDVLQLLLCSVALEELGIGHVLNAMGEVRHVPV